MSSVRPTRIGRPHELTAAQSSAGVVTGDDIDWPTGPFTPATLTVEESDGSPSVPAVDTVILNATDFTLVDNADGSVTVTTDEPDTAAHLADTSDAHDASAISIVDAGTYFTATDVEGALQELGAGGGGGGPSFATPAIVLGTAAAAGAASTVIRSDSTIVAFDATAPVTQAFSDAAATGSAAVAARRDHKHGMPASPGGGTPGYVLLATQTASSSAQLDFAGFISGTYDDYVFRLTDIVAATNGASLNLRVGTGGGPTYDAGANYNWTRFYADGSGSGVGSGSGATAATLAILVSSTAPTQLELRLVNPSGTTYTKHMYAHGAQRASDGGFYSIPMSHQEYTPTTAVTAIRFLMSSGNIASGIIRVYGVLK